MSEIRKVVVSEAGEPPDAVYLLVGPVNDDGSVHVGVWRLTRSAVDDSCGRVARAIAADLLDAAAKATP